MANINCTRRYFKKGDRVRIVHYKTRIAWGERKPREFGFVESVNGAYIYVRPAWRPRSEQIEFYPGEIVLANR